jgi:hypothetical protein
MPITPSTSMRKSSFLSRHEYKKFITGARVSADNAAMEDYEIRLGGEFAHFQPKGSMDCYPMLVLRGGVRMEMHSDRGEWRTAVHQAEFMLEGRWHYPRKRCKTAICCK